MILSCEVILFCDFNTCLKPEDRYPCLRSNDNSVSALKLLMSKCNLIDTWQCINKEKLGYTYHDKKTNSYSRLDYIFISKEINYELIESSICQPVKQPGVVDHNALKATFNCNELQRGPGYWKLNNSVLKEQNYIKGINKTIENTLKDFHDMKSNQLIWEILKLNMKEFTVQYCIEKKKSKASNFKAIQEELDKINEKVLFLDTKENLTKLDRDELISNKTRKLELESQQFKYIEEKAKGHCIRSRAKWTEEGEVCSKFFLGLEKQRQSGNVIRKVKVTENKFVCKNNEILEEATKYYQRLYSNKNISNIKINNYFNQFANIRSLNKDDRKLCEEDISKSELREVIKNLKRNKAPGLDGLTNEFYQAFWDLLEPHFIKMLQESFRIGILPGTVRKAIMTIIFKQGDKTILSNYRPISLTNCDYKIIAFVLAKRLQNAASKLISENQSGYIKNRYIGFNARLLNDIIENCEKNNKSGACKSKPSFC